jgi:hypothetical protein
MRLAGALVRIRALSSDDPEIGNQLVSKIASYSPPTFSAIFCVPHS